ncbi:hypothetical protein CITRIK5_20581 [Citricoccus sp. K5]|nr:hypothetical protein CITRIK5_20581 [Citricoccus sp. K5]
MDVVVRCVLQSDAAFGAQALTSRPADRLEGQGRDHGVPEDWLQIHRLMNHQALFVAPTLRGGREEQLLQVNGDPVLDRVQATTALSHQLGVSLTGDQDAFVDRLQTQVDVHG